MSCFLLNKKFANSDINAYYHGAIAMEAGFNASKYKRDKFKK